MSKRCTIMPKLAKNFFYSPEFLRTQRTLHGSQFEIDTKILPPVCVFHGILQHQVVRIHRRSCVYLLTIVRELCEHPDLFRIEFKPRIRIQRISVEVTCSRCPPEENRSVEITQQGSVEVSKQMRLSEKQ